MSDPENQRFKRPIPISTQEFDHKVEGGEDINDHLDWEKAETIMPGELSRREEITLLKEKALSLLNTINALRARIEKFEEQEVAP